MQNVRIISIPPCKMVASPVGMFGEENFDRFMDWMDRQKSNSIHPRDFLTGEDGLLKWYYIYNEDTDAEGFEIEDFPGGLYAVTTDIDQMTDMAAMKKELAAFLSAHKLKIDPSRAEMGNIISSPEATEILGYEQMDYYTPVCPADLSDSPLK